MVQEEEVPMGTRRQFTPEVNARVVLELIGGVKSLAEDCREYQLKPQRLARWKGEFLDKVPRVFRGDEREDTARARITE
jgi:transposase-like protein